MKKMMSFPKLIFWLNSHILLYIKQKTMCSVLQGIYSKIVQFIICATFICICMQLKTNCCELLTLFFSLEVCKFLSCELLSAHWCE